MLFKVEVPHSELEGDDDYHEWVDVWLPEHVAHRGPRTVRLDSLGRRNRGWRLWNRWCCNNPECKGVLLVNTDKLVDIVNTFAKAAGA